MSLALIQTGVVRLNDFSAIQEYGLSSRVVTAISRIIWGNNLK